MRKKILTVLAPVLAIMAFAVLPAVSQADEIQGEHFTATSLNLKTHLGEGTFECTTSELQFQKVASNQAVVVGGGFRGMAGEEQYCQTSAAGVYIDFQTNLDCGWYLHVDGNGQGRLQTPSGTTQESCESGRIQFVWDLYVDVGGTKINTGISCHYESAATDGSVMASYSQNTLNPTISVHETFVAQEPSEHCEEEMQLQGSFSTAGGVEID